MLPFTSPRHPISACKESFVRVQDESKRALAEATQDSQGYVASLQQELSSARDAAAAAAADLDAERRSAGEAKAQAASRVDALEVMSPHMLWCLHCLVTRVLFISIT